MHFMDVELQTESDIYQRKIYNDLVEILSIENVRDMQTLRYIQDLVVMGFEMRDRGLTHEQAAVTYRNAYVQAVAKLEEVGNISSGEAKMITRTA